MIIACERLVVVGAGGIGAGVGALLARAGLPVELVARGPHLAAMRERGLRVRRPAEDLRVRLPCHADPAEVSWRPGDVALVATKLNDAEAAYTSLLAAAGPRLPVVVAQNGLAADPWARARFEHVIDTMTFVPAQHLTPGEVSLYGLPVPGAIDVSSSGAALAAWLRRAGFRSAAREDILRWRRAKWMTNLANLAILAGREDLRPAVLAEGRAVLAAAGLDVASEAEFDAYLGDIGVGLIKGAARLPGGSMAQSHERGRPLEAPWLNGSLVALAREHGLEAPLNTQLLAELCGTD